MCSAFALISVVPSLGWIFRSQRDEFGDEERKGIIKDTNFRRQQSSCSCSILRRFGWGLIGSDLFWKYTDWLESTRWKYTISERWNASTGTPEFRRSDTPPQREVIVHMIIGVNTPKNFENLTLKMLPRSALSKQRCNWSFRLVNITLTAQC